MRLIDADALPVEDLDYDCDRGDVRDFIDAAPTVCCGECANMDADGVQCLIHGDQPEPNDGCNYFERRTP